MCAWTTSTTKTTLYYLGLLCIIRIFNNFIFLGYYIFSADITYIF